MIFAKNNLEPTFESYLENLWPSSVSLDVLADVPQVATPLPPEAVDVLADVPQVAIPLPPDVLADVPQVAIPLPPEAVDASERLSEPPRGVEGGFRQQLENLRDRVALLEELVGAHTCRCLRSRRDLGMGNKDVSDVIQVKPELTLLSA